MEVSDQFPALAALPPGKEPLVPIGLEVGWRSRVWVCGLDSSGWGKGAAAGCYKDGNETSSTLKAGNLTSW